MKRAIRLTAANGSSEPLLPSIVYDGRGRMPLKGDGVCGKVWGCTPNAGLGSGEGNPSIDPIFSCGLLQESKVLQLEERRRRGWEEEGEKKTKEERREEEKRGGGERREEGGGERREEGRGGRRGEGGGEREEGRGRRGEEGGEREEGRGRRGEGDEEMNVEWFTRKVYIYAVGTCLVPPHHAIQPSLNSSHLTKPLPPSGSSLILC